MARHYRTLSEEFDVQLNWAVAGVTPGLVALHGIGTDHAATLLVAAAQNPER